MDDPDPIPFNRPFLVGKELHYISQAVLAGHLAGNGPFSKRCHAWLEARTGSARALLTPSCTAALEMCALLLEVGPGDEVVLPAYTFVSTANAFVLRGATLRFVDVRDDTLNLDEGAVEAAVGPRTKVVCPVHYAGVACEMDAIAAAAARVGAAVVEDAAQGLGASYRGRALGGLGALGTLSFHETKNCIAGEGGALLVNDPALAARAQILWEKGTNRTQFLRGEVDKYTWVDVGSSFTPSELVAAFLFAQFEHAEAITAARLATWERYHQGLEELERSGELRRPVVPEGCRHNAHLYQVRVANLATRDALLAHLRARGIHAVFHYVPLHTSPMGRAMGYGPGDLPVTEAAGATLVRLPLYYEIQPEQVDRVLAAVRGFFQGGSGAA